MPAFTDERVWPRKQLAVAVPSINSPTDNLLQIAIHGKRAQIAADLRVVVVAAAAAACSASAHVSCPFAPVPAQSVVFESYHIQEGTDRTGVPTKMMSVNATVRLRFRNRGTFFSLHVTATPFLLFFGELTVASGEVRAPALFLLPLSK